MKYLPRALLQLALLVVLLLSTATLYVVVLDSPALLSVAHQERPEA